MRTVVCNPYHLWANEIQSHARNAGNTQSFDGATAYSYAAEIGKIVTNAQGEKAFLLNTHTYSVTTSRHQSELRRAIPPGSTIFNVGTHGYLSHSYMQTDHGANLKSYLEQIATLRAKAKRARTYKDSYERRILELCAECQRYMEFFGLANESKNLQGHIDVEVQRLEELRKAEELRQKEAQKRLREQAEEHIQAWLKGESDVFPYNVHEDFLRVSKDGSTVQTSRHCDAPIEHVLKALPCVLRVMRSGSVWVPNGSELRLGHYTVRRIDSKGIQVGCHYFKRAEVERFAAVVEIPMRRYFNSLTMEASKGVSA